jgi:glycosyltransferase involved in cell wall biosynthesis
MSPPRLSVIVPSFNQGEFLGNTLLSIISQDYNNLELIVIDGASTDNSVNVIQQFENHIHYWVSEDDRGQSHAINKGFAKATGDILCWLNSDDLFCSGTLHEVRSEFETNQDAECLNGAAVIFGKGEEMLQSMKPVYDLSERLAGMPSPQPSFFFKRSALEKIGLIDENLHYGMDYDFFLRMALQCKMLNLPHKIWSKYRIHDQSKTSGYKLKFAKEWAAIFSTLLSQFNEKKHIENWSELGLFDPLKKKYLTSQTQIKKGEMQLAAGLALLNLSVFYNLGGNIKTCLNILSKVQTSYPEAYKLRKTRNIHWKLWLKSFF